jgi:hypothetical protein
MISAVPSVSSVHVELDGRLPSTAGRTDETTKGTSGWAGVTITKFFTIKSSLSDGCSESGTVWGLSWKVTEHVVTYITSLVCYPNILSVPFRGSIPFRDPRFVEIFLSFLSL